MRQKCYHNFCMRRVEEWVEMIELANCPNIFKRKKNVATVSSLITYWRNFWHNELVFILVSHFFTNYCLRICLSSIWFWITVVLSPGEFFCHLRFVLNWIQFPVSLLFPEWNNVLYEDLVSLDCCPQTI